VVFSFGFLPFKKSMALKIKFWDLKKEWPLFVVKARRTTFMLETMSFSFHFLFQEFAII
jgi:hypothetical protein